VSNHLSAVECWIFSIAYTLQIYFDFSGYSDMAIGSALMLGVEIPRNFDAPLRSKSIIEFWQRWHISLSDFITSYLYTPILKSFERATLATASIATLIAMTIAGLWHGPSWTFVLFGLLHGIGLVANQYWRKKKMPKLNWFPSWLLTFILVDVAFIFFRSPSVPAGAIMARNLFNPHDAFTTHNWRAMHDGFSLKVFGIPMVAGSILAVYGKASDQMAHEFKRNYRTVAAVSALMIISWLFINSTISQSFVYFKF
jgi:D-alanyl-lipoteichoic acid acyltransferase DltB (MBOAT superfamily)